MRLRHIPGAEQMIEENPHVVHGAKEKKGTWQQIFGNDHPIRIEVGMGKGQFILEQASRNPDVNFVGIEKYSTVLLKAIRKREQMELSNIYFLCEDARELAALVHDINCHINLIPVNPIKERDYVQSDNSAIQSFKNKLEKSGINVTIRREMGRDIDGACGQLRKSYMDTEKERGE